LLLLLLAGLPAAANAATPTPATWTGAQRHVAFASDEQGFHFTSVRAEAPDAEVLSGAFVLDDASYEWAYAPNRSVAPGACRVVFTALLEVRDRDGDARYGPGDQLVQRIQLPGTKNASLQLLPGGPGGRFVQASYPFSRPGPGPLDPLTGKSSLLVGAFRLRFHVLEESDLIDARNVPPTLTPVQVQVDGFPRNESGTLLVLELLLRSTGAAHSDGDAWRVPEPGWDHVGHWASTYDGNGTTRIAGVLLLQAPGPAGLGAGAGSTTFLGAYGAGRITHSFSFGAEPHEPSSSTVARGLVARVLGDASVYGTTAAAMALLVGASAWARLRRDG
jgi:hypothetical protein